MNVLVLNASYEVLNVTRWQRAITLVFSGKAELLESYDAVIRTPDEVFEMPSVIRLVYLVKKPRTEVPFSRSNVLMRDRFTCQYCETTGVSATLTLDHVTPRAQGGDTCWENIVTACRLCNSKKGSRTPEKAGMRLKKKPKAPYFTPAIQMHFRQDWEKYIPYAITPQSAKAG